MSYSRDLEELNKAALRQTWLMTDLEQEEFELITHAMSFLPLEAGKEIIRQGEASDFLAIVISGAFEVSRIVDNRKDLPTIVKSGAVLGEVGMFGNSERFATCTAVKPSLVGILEREQFNGIKATNPKLHGKLIERIALMMAGRLQAVSEIVLSMRAKKSIAIEAAKKILEFGVA